ncbi:hypothetical protein GCM10023224_45370 [Streptomonospora halophila]|uniref:Uncharacterized protein n=1 Tax=Streptomonospora halophila TaxID=427369 RepID=A0ABP9GWN6_9ACTN
MMELCAAARVVAEDPVHGYAACGSAPGNVRGTLLTGPAQARAARWIRAARRVSADPLAEMVLRTHGPNPPDDLYGPAPGPRRGHRDMPSKSELCGGLLAETRWS